MRRDGGASAAPKAPGRAGRLFFPRPGLRPAAAEAKNQRE